MIALQLGAVGRTGCRSKSLVPRTVIQLLVKERHCDFGRRCHASVQTFPLKELNTSGPWIFVDAGEEDF